MVHVLLTRGESAVGEQSLVQVFQPGVAAATGVAVAGCGLGFWLWLWLLLWWLLSFGIPACSFVHESMRANSAISSTSIMYMYKCYASVQASRRASRQGRKHGWLYEWMHAWMCACVDVQMHDCMHCIGVCVRV